MNILHILPLEPDDMDREDRRTVKPPILLNKQYAEPTAFAAENLLRKARRQKSLARVNVPRICILDPDGDIVRWLVRTQGLECDAGWACYHTNLYQFTHEGTRFGVVGCAAGASFAVLVAEELFASGCELLISVTSAGQIVRIEKDLEKGANGGSQNALQIMALAAHAWLSRRTT